MGAGRRVRPLTTAVPLSRESESSAGSSDWHKAGLDIEGYDASSEPVRLERCVAADTEKAKFVTSLVWRQSNTVSIFFNLRSTLVAIDWLLVA